MVEAGAGSVAARAAAEADHLLHLLRHAKTTDWAGAERTDYNTRDGALQDAVYVDPRANICQDCTTAGRIPHRFSRNSAAAECRYCRRPRSSCGQIPLPGVPSFPLPSVGKGRVRAGVGYGAITQCLGSRWCRGPGGKTAAVLSLARTVVANMGCPEVVLPLWAS